MKIGIMMRDREFRDAMIDAISAYDGDILAEVSEGRVSSADSVILTDVSPEEIGDKALAKLRGRTVFMSSVKPEDDGSGIHRVFKYGGLDSILTELSIVYSSWTGDAGSAAPLSRSIAVCSEYDLLSKETCMALARQIIYRKGGGVLIVPLSHVNDYRNSGNDEGSFRRLMYMIDAGKDIPRGAFMSTDTYGVSFLSMGRGLNPVAELDSMYLNRLIQAVSRGFETLILDIGTCYRKENLELISRADGVVFAGSTGRMYDPAGMLCPNRREELRTISSGPETDVAMAIDDYVAWLYGDEKHAEKRSDEKIRQRDRRDGQGDKAVADRNRPRA